MRFWRECFTRGSVRAVSEILKTAHKKAQLTQATDLHTQAGTASGPEGNPITKIKLPHVGGHEGVGRIIALGPGCDEDIKIGSFVGIRFASRVCRRCEFCLAGTEQYCVKSTNHLHHEDGSFQEYIALDAGYLTLLPDDIDPAIMGPVLCAGLTSYKVRHMNTHSPWHADSLLIKAVKNANIKAGDSVVVVGAGGGLGHLAGMRPDCTQQPMLALSNHKLMANSSSVRPSPRSAGPRC